MQNALTGATISNEEVSELSKLCQLYLKWRKRIEQLEIALSEAKENFTKLSAGLIPDKMLDLGVSELKLADGAKVTVQPFYSGGLLEGKEAEAIEWLDKHGHGGIVKRSIICPFQKGEEAAVKKLVKQLEKMQVEFQRKEGVHPQTFKAFLRELTENGKSLPPALFTAFIGKTTKITAVT